MMSLQRHGKRWNMKSTTVYGCGVLLMFVLVDWAAMAIAQEAETQPVTTQPTSRPTTTTSEAPPHKYVPGGAITLNFRDASLRTVLEYLSDAAGLVIVDETRPQGRVTLVSRQPISVEEAVSLLDTVLKEKGYAAIRNGRILKIVTLDQAKTEFIPVRTGNDPKSIQPTDRMITQIIPIRTADAIKLKADLATLIPESADVASNASSNTLIITATESTVRRIVEIIHAIDMSEVSQVQVKVFQLKYANAANAANLIKEIFSGDQATQQQQAFRRRFAFPGRPGGSGSSETGQKNTKVTASADERTNTLVISAAPEVMTVISNVIKELDANPAETEAVFIYHLRNAEAANVTDVLNNLFGTGSGSSGGSSSSRNTGTSRGSTFGSGGSSSMRGLSSSSSRSSNNSTRSSSSGSRRSFSSSTRAGTADLVGQVYVVADEDSNSLLVTTASKNFERVKAIIADLDRSVPQVLIKVLIAEVTHSNSLDLGMEFSGLNLSINGKNFNAGSDFSVAAQTGGFMFTLNEEHITSAIRAIAGVAKLDILSRPYILTSDNQEASIMVGQSVPFVTNTQTYDSGTVSNTIEYEDIGIILEVTPHINPQGLVTLDVYPEISTLTGETVPISETLTAPVFAKRYAESKVAIRDGQTIVIGGLMEDSITTSVEKVPILGDIPVIGALFRRTIKEKSKTELLIFLTPHVAQQPDELKEMTESEKEGLKIVPNAVEPGAFQEHLKGMQRGASTKPASQKIDEQSTDILPASSSDEKTDEPGH